MSPTFDIFKKDAAAVIWVEAAESLDAAKKRIEELAKKNDCEYIVFDQRRQQVVASLNSIKAVF